MFCYISLFILTVLIADIKDFSFLANQYFPCLGDRISYRKEPNLNFLCNIILRVANFLQIINEYLERDMLEKGQGGNKENGSADGFISLFYMPETTPLYFYIVRFFIK